MNNRRHKPEAPSSAKQPVPGQLGYRQLNYYQLQRGWRRLSGGIRRMVIIGVILVPILLFTAWRSASQPSARLTEVTRYAQNVKIASQVNSLLSQQAAHQQFSGSVLIAYRDQVLLSKGYSMADWQRRVPNTPDTRFYLGSTSKQFTAMAILILQERGKLHVSDHLCTYIVPCPPAWQPVTIHEVLTHTSGIPQLDGSSLSTTSPRSWIASFNSFSLVSTPASQFSYCSICYQILGYVVEQVSGESYSAFLQQAIFGPLHMQDSGSGDADYTSILNHAAGYAGWQVLDTYAGMDVTPQWTFLFGSGLVYSNAEDMYRWDQALSHYTLVSQQTLKEAFTPYVASQYAGSSYGYGWFIAHSPVPGHRLIWHDGKIPGFRTYIGRYPDDGVTIIILSNLATVDEMALAHELEQIVFAYV
jgi:CubicO group peptidase (beta-lactamase class C family)